jgi:glutamine amidotransferase
MCRLLVVRDETPFDPGEMLRPFAAAARASKEYQGDGWGCAWPTADGWGRYRTVTPIWEDRLDRFSPTRILVAHARSAFRNEGVVVENNMPFVEGEHVFAFNGELRGVRIAEEGGTGAAKLFRFLVRTGNVHPVEALARGLDLVARRTRYVRALNLVVAAGPEVLVASRFGEDPDYFTMRRVTRGTRRIVASDPIDAGSDWAPIANGTVMALG